MSVAAAGMAAHAARAPGPAAALAPAGGPPPERLFAEAVAEAAKPAPRAVGPVAPEPAEAVPAALPHTQGTKEPAPARRHKRTENVVAPAPQPHAAPPATVLAAPVPAAAAAAAAAAKTLGTPEAASGLPASSAAPVAAPPSDGAAPRSGALTAPNVAAGPAAVSAAASASAPEGQAGPQAATAAPPAGSPNAGAAAAAGAAKGTKSQAASGPAAISAPPAPAAARRDAPALAAMQDAGKPAPASPAFLPTAAAAAAITPPVASAAAPGTTAPAAGAPADAAPAAAAPGTAAPARSVPATQAAALAASVSAMLKDGKATATIRLDPPDLGSMSIHVAAGANASINVLLLAAVPQTAHAFAAGAGDLRQAFAAAGLTLGRLDVGGEPGANAGGRDQPPSPPAPVQLEAAAANDVPSGVRALA